jgi:hypothetical protein
MVWSIFTNDSIDTVSIFYWIRGESYDHIWVLTRSMYMNMSISQDRLEDACDFSIDLLYSIQTTFTHSSWERWDLVDTDDPLVCDYEEIELIIDPW